MRNKGKDADLQDSPKPAFEDSFLSVEDLDLATLSEQELEGVWEAWFEAAQATNDADHDRYSHACFGEYAPYPVGPKDPPTSL